MIKIPKTHSEVKGNLFKISALFLFAFLFWVDIGSCQDKYQLSFQVSPSFETMNLRNKLYNSAFGYKLSYNFGGEYKIFLTPNFAFSTGVNYQKKGFRNVLSFTTTDQDSSFFSQSVLIGVVDYIVVPMDVNFHITLKRRTSLVLFTGVSHGVRLRSALVGKRIPEEISDRVPFDADNGFNEFDIFRRYFLGINMGIGLSKYFKQKWMFTLRPSYTRQLNKAAKPDAPLQSDEIATPKLDSFFTDIKIGYFFNKNINNDKKTFY